MPLIQTNKNLGIVLSGSERLGEVDELVFGRLYSVGAPVVDRSDDEVDGDDRRCAGGGEDSACVPDEHDASPGEEVRLLAAIALSVIFRLILSAPPGRNSFTSI